MIGRALPVWSIVLTVLLIAVLVVGALTADPDGRGISRSGEGADYGWETSASPYPGLFYGTSFFVAITVLVVLTALVLRMVARRPAVADTHEADDLLLRRASARRVLAGVQLITATMLAGLALTAGQALRTVGRGVATGSGWWTESADAVDSDSLVWTALGHDSVLIRLGEGQIRLGVIVLLSSLVVAGTALNRSRMVLTTDQAPGTADQAVSTEPTGT